MRILFEQPFPPMAAPRDRGGCPFHLQLLQVCLLLLRLLAADLLQQVGGLLTFFQPLLQLRSEIQQGKALGDPGLGAVQPDGQRLLRPVNPQQSCQRPGLVQVSELVAVPPAGDEFEAAVLTLDPQADPEQQVEFGEVHGPGRVARPAQGRER
ncbi:hypothetical protein ACIGBL_34580 [Streptomyces sp. NPDC085614]|uniref:hypothetical protein n=1 Tax=Streptomyces sp. NPDC085614 TaxID=3365733 RepID=UPI0037D010C3